MEYIHTARGRVRRGRGLGRGRGRGLGRGKGTCKIFDGVPVQDAPRAVHFSEQQGAEHPSQPAVPT